MDTRSGEACPGGDCNVPRFRSAASRHNRRLTAVLILVTAFLAVEIVGALASGSLAMLAEAGHMLTDIGSLGLTIFSIWFAQRRASPQKTYGYYRAEILAALANAIILFAVSGVIFYEAYRRIAVPPVIDTLPMLVVAGLGLVVNAVSLLLLHRGAEESLNVHSVFLEVLNDAFGSLAVVGGAIVMLTTGFYLIDPLLSVLVGLLILPRTWRLLNRALNVLLEGTPSHISVAEVRESILALPEVSDVHDLHIWTITPGLESLSAHIIVRPPLDRRAALERAHSMVRQRFGIEHLTIQVEEEELCEFHLAE